MEYKYWFFYFQNMLTVVYLLSPDVFQLINYVSFVEGVALFMCVLGLLWQRRKNPNVSRPIKVSTSSITGLYIRIPYQCNRLQLFLSVY